MLLAEMAKADAVEADVSNCRLRHDDMVTQRNFLVRIKRTSVRAFRYVVRSAAQRQYAGGAKRKLTAEPGVDQRADDDAHLDALGVVEGVVLRAGGEVDPNDPLALEVAVAASLGEGGGRERRLGVHGGGALVVLDDGAVGGDEDVGDVCFFRYCGHCRAWVSVCANERTAERARFVTVTCAVGPEPDKATGSAGLQMCGAT